MVDQSAAAAPVREGRVAPVAGPEDRTAAERALRAAEDAPTRPDAPERMVVRLTLAENQAATTSTETVAAGLEAVRDQLEALRDLVVAGRLEARVVAEPMTVAVPDAVARLERTIRAVMAPTAAVAPAPVVVARAPTAAEVEVADAPVPVALGPVAARDTALAPPSSTGLVPLDLDVALAPASVDTGLVPLRLDTSLAPASATGLVPVDLDTSLAPASVGTALVPAEVDVALATSGEGNGLVPAGVPTTLGAIRSAALLVTTDPEVTPALETPAGEGVPVVLQHRPFQGPSTPVALMLPEPEATSQSLLAGAGNGLRHVDLAGLAPERLGLDQVVGAPTTQALQVVDDAIATVDRAAADLGRVRQEIELATERAVLGAVPPDPVAGQVLAAVTDEVRASIALQAVAALMASVAGLDRRHAERLIIDAPAHAQAARRPPPVQILAMSASAARS